MLSASQAEGYAGGGDGDGSVLEEYLDSLLVMPVEVRRYITLMRDLDRSCDNELTQLRTLQAECVEAARSKCQGVSSAAERGRLTAALRGEDPRFARVARLRGDVAQKIAEKRSVAEQLFDMSEHNLRRLSADIKYLEDLFRNSGELPDLGLAAGREVAAWVDKDQVWILARVSEVHAQEVTVADAEDSSQRFTLPQASVVVLPDKETLLAAKGRLSMRGRKIYAIYPDTTSFYKGTLVSVPYKDSGGASAAALAQGGAPLAKSSVVHPPGTILVNVQFDDDMDQATGLTPKHAVNTKYVFVSPI